MTTTKTLLTMAVSAALPFGAMAENISGAMYNAPATADTNHPAPTTQADAPYGRANIDTADQEHIATTAYVKGAYNSAIAAVNSVIPINDVTREPMQTNVISSEEMVDVLIYRDISGTDRNLISAGAVADGILRQRVEIYTTWDDDDTTDVALKTALPE